MMTESYHTSTEHSSSINNNHNFGIGYEYTMDEGLGSHVGTYYNSFSHLTVFGGVHLKKEAIPHLKYSITISLATGYEKELGYSLQPIMTWGLQYYFIRVVTTYPLPELAGGGSVFNLQFVYDF